MAAPNFPMKGHCYCKAVEFTMNAKPIFTNCCHCRNCQAVSGSAFALNCMVEASNVSTTSDTKPEVRTQPPTAHSHSQAGATGYHCPTCGIMLWGTLNFLGDELVFVRTGTLEENEKIVPDAHFFVRSKHPWITIPDGATVYEAMPDTSGPMWTGEAKARIDAVTKK